MRAPLSDFSASVPVTVRDHTHFKPLLDVEQFAPMHYDGGKLKVSHQRLGIKHDTAPRMCKKLWRVRFRNDATFSSSGSTQLDMLYILCFEEGEHFTRLKNISVLSLAVTNLFDQIKFYAVPDQNSDFLRFFQNSGHSKHDSAF